MSSSSGTSRSTRSSTTNSSKESNKPSGLNKEKITSVKEGNKDRKSTITPSSSSTPNTKESISSSSNSSKQLTTSNNIINLPINTEKCIPFFPSTLFEENSFKENFNEIDFIENLTYKLLNEVNKTNNQQSSNNQNQIEEKQAEYCEIFQQLFERSTFELEKLMKDVNIKIEKYANDTEIAAVKHQNKLKTFQEELENVSEKFKNLEDVINQVGNTTVQIGNTLETVDKQKSRAIEAKQLMRFFNEFNSYDPELFINDILPNKKFKHAIFKKKQTQHKAAKILQELSVIATDLTKVDNCKNAISNINKYNEYLLDNLLKDFSQAIKLIEDNRKVAITEMKKRAKILIDIKNEEKCIELFVTKRFEKFINVSDILEKIEKDMNEKMNVKINELEKKIESLTSSNSSNKKDNTTSNDDDEEDSNDQTSNSNNTTDNTETIKTLQQEIENTRNETKIEKAKLIDAAFLDAKRKSIESVTNVQEYSSFLSKIEKATSSEYSIIEEVFTESSRDVILTFLQKIVDTVLIEIVNRILKEPNNDKDIKELENYLYLFEDIYTCTSNFLDRLINEHSNKIPTLKINLTRSIENIFINKKKSYGNIEKNYVSEYYNSVMKDIKDKQTYTIKLLYELQLKKGLHSNSYFSYNSLNFSQVVYLAMQDNEQYNILQEYPQLQLDIVVSLMHTNIDALNRCKKLSIKNDIPKNMYTIFELLKETIYEYVKGGLEYAVATLETIKKEPMLIMYDTIHLTNSVLQKIQRHLEQYVLPSIISISLPIQLQCIKLKDDLFISLESLVVKGLELLLKGIVDYCKIILDNEQKKHDYKPKENDAKFAYIEYQPTQACIKSCDFLSKHCNRIQQCLFGKNREYFLTKLGLHFYNLLSNSLKQLVVNNSGAIKLMRDLSEYQKCMRQFQVSIVEDQFDTLREISNVLLVMPNNLPDVVQQLEKNPNVKREDIMAFVKMRSDYKSSKLKELLTKYQ
ncbi:hypothetical protein ABK040_007462 [Willaertia magna]